MSKLNVDQKSVKGLLTDKHSDFLIPDYQRPYAWGEDECATLWDDLFAFAFPGDDCDAFNSDTDEYFLGPIVTFENSDGKLEVIDGQQRLTTIMLLLRAFYDKFVNMQDKQSVTVRTNIARCVWKTDEFDEPKFDELKIDSEVASDDDKDEFLSILKNGKVEPGWKSAYASNYVYFQGKIANMTNNWPSYVALLAMRILNNVILLPIEADGQDAALRIFSTLNDRGLPLADADIFKSQFYKHYAGEGHKDEFIARWKNMEDTADRIFHPMTGTPMDELFTRYMYYRRALMGIRNTTTASLRDFYSMNSYAILKEDQSLDDLESLIGFWDRVDSQEGFSERVLRRLYVLGYAPNGMWTYLLSTWYLANKDEDGELDDQALFDFLCLITGFIYAYAIERPGVNALRSPVYPELINIVNHRPVTFEQYRFDRDDINARFHAYQYTNQRRFTRSMLVWWAFTDPEQKLLSQDTVLEVEHIYAKKRNDNYPLHDQSQLEALGNKAMLEKTINIRASDFRFADKRKYYEGFIDAKGVQRPRTANHELLKLVETKDDFTEQDIVARTNRIIDTFVDSLGELGLLREA